MHLGWDDALSVRWQWDGLWQTPAVEPELLMSVDGLCRAIKRRFDEDRKFPYALAWLNSSFDPSGRLRLTPGARGLTCATFVLAVFSAVGILLVDEGDWPIRIDEDRQWLAWIANFATPTHLAILSAEVESGIRRIRPEEVAGACAASKFPAVYEVALGRAAAIVAQLP